MGLLQRRWSGLGFRADWEETREQSYKRLKQPRSTRPLQIPTQQCQAPQRAERGHQKRKKSPSTHLRRSQLSEQHQRAQQA